MTRKGAFVVACAALLSACGARGDVDGTEGGVFSQVRDVRLPDAVPATPAYAVHSDEPLSNEELKRLRTTPGVAVVAPVRLEKMTIRGPSGNEVLRVGAIDPLAFRSVAPPVTREADFVWVSLIGGQTVLTFDAAQSLGIEDSGRIHAESAELRVGAFADNGVPNVADLLVDVSRAPRLGIVDPEIALVGAETGAEVDSLDDALRRRIPGARLRPLVPSVPAQLEPPDDPQIATAPEGGVIGSMRYRILENGFIEPDPAWVESNIAYATVPILGTVRCHRLMIPQLAAALGEIERAGLAGLIRPDDYGGCYVPRFIDRNPSNPLSMHAFGLAVDINVSTNQLGTAGDMDPRIVAIFEKWGFQWGGRWSRPDPMHFEVARLIQM
jgi:hypothetical protein